MCFSNLPIEFDDEGNPYLADEADDVDRPSSAGAESECASASDCGCADESGDVPLNEADPEAVYEELLETMPSDVREQLVDSSGPTTPDASDDRRERGQTD